MKLIHCLCDSLEFTSENDILEVKFVEILLKNNQPLFIQFWIWPLTYLDSVNTFDINKWIIYIF